MGKRLKVPTALHSELSDYAALLRALRTSDTLDLSIQLTRASTSSQPVLAAEAVYEVSDADEDEGESERPLTESASLDDLSEHVPAALGKRKRKSASSSRKGKTRDAWTRWPLMAGDVYVPEFGLEDEVKALALGLLKPIAAAAPDSPFAVPSEVESKQRDIPEYPDEPPDDPVLDTSDDTDPEDIILPPAVLRVLTDASATHISRILALLAAHVPSTAKSMMNRMCPLNWETVVDIIGANGLVDANILQNVSRRLEAIYGPSRSHAVDRAQSASSVELRLAGVSAAHELSFLALSGYEQQQLAVPRKRKRGPYKKQKKSLER